MNVLRVILLVLFAALATSCREAPEPCDCERHARAAFVIAYNYLVDVDKHRDLPPAHEDNKRYQNGLMRFVEDVIPLYREAIKKAEDFRR